MKSFAGLRARIMAVGSDIEAAAARVIAEAAQEAMEDARENAPVGTGIRREPRLVDSFSCRAEGLYGEMKIANPHAAYVEFGTGMRGAQSAGAAAGGRYDPDWPGMAAQPYMQPAAQRARAGFAEKMRTETAEAAGGRRNGRW